jgi:hypothetical protein
MRKSLDALRRPADTEEMTAAINWLEKQGHFARRPTPWQLKVGRINFYPHTGTIFCDGDSEPLPHRGLAAFQKLLERDNDRSIHILKLGSDS